MLYIMDPRVDLIKFSHYKLLTHPMHRQNSLLRFSLDCNILSGLLNGEPDRSGICCITLVTDIEGLGKPRLHQSDLMPLLTLTGPMVRPATRLHAYREGRRFAKNSR